MAKTDRNSWIKRDRRAILAHLNMCWPGSLPLEELYLILLDGNPIYERKFLVRDLMYLREKNYLYLSRIDGNDLRSVIVAECKAVLTALGTDVANQLIDDPVLEV